jgi:putative ABC transport system permease protein
MIINNLRVIIRRLGRQKLNTALHTIGLTLGISVCLLIGLFLRHELSFDAYHANADRIYRINTVMSDQGEMRYDFSSPAPLANALRAEIPELEQVARVQPDRGNVIEINPQKRFEQDNVLLAEPAFLNIFDIEVLQGNGHEALRNPFQALLTETTAKKFFGNEDPIGKTFKCKNEYTFTVAGIVRDQPGNTHLPFTMLLSFAENINFPGCDTSPMSWGTVSGGSTFVVLPENLKPGDLATRLQDIYDRNINEMADMPEWLRFHPKMQDLDRIHLEPQWQGGGAWVKAVNPTWLWFFGSIGLAVLGLACVNFINLSTAQAIQRSREVAVRKSIGAQRGQLVAQFLGEALLLATLAGVLSVGVATAALPELNDLLDKKISFDLLQSLGLLGGLFGGVLLTGLLAGLYPAWALSRYQPATALKTGAATAGDSRSAGLRKGLVVTQFMLSVGLLAALIIMSRQMQYFRNKNIGFDRENTVIVQIPEVEKQGVFAAELSKIPAVSDVTFFSTPPSHESHWGTVMSHVGQNDPAAKKVTLIWADDHFGKMFNLKLLAGRLSEPNDTTYLSNPRPDGNISPLAVVNEKLVKEMGFASPEDALGKRLWIGMRGYWPEIVGVVADFNTASLHEDVNPTLITAVPRFQQQGGIKISANSDIPATLAAIEAVWSKTFPTGVVNTEFLDDNIQAFYLAETRLFHLFQIFTGLAILISCLGLFGLAAFSAEQRTKEIGIRKVMGASVAGITVLLTKDFLKLVVVAIVAASPMVYWAMSKWLADFAYRIELQWWMFALAGVAAVVIAFLTVSFQSIRAALANPVESLRSE